MNNTGNSSVLFCVLGLTAPRQVVQAYILGAISVAGVLLNILSMVTFSRLRTSSRAHQFLIALGVWDCILLVSAACVHNVPVVAFGRMNPVPMWYAKSYGVSHALSNISLTATLWMVLALTLDRYMAVCNPFRHLVSLSPGSQRGKLVVMLISVLALLQGLIIYFEADTTPCVVQATRTLLGIVHGSELRLDMQYKVYYRFIGGLLLHSTLPVVLLFFFLARTSFTIYKAQIMREDLTHTRQLKRSASMRRHSNSSMYGVAMTVKSRLKPKVRENNAMFICVALKFFLGRLLTATLDFLEMTMYEEQYQASAAINTLIDVSTVFIQLNSASNFFLYVAMGSRFRKAMLSTIKGNCCKRMIDSEMMTDSRLPESVMLTARQSPYDQRRTKESRRPSNCRMVIEEQQGSPLSVIYKQKRHQCHSSYYTDELSTPNSQPPTLL